MPRTTVNEIEAQLSAIEYAKTVLFNAADSDGIESKNLIDAAIYIINLAVPAIRDCIENPCPDEMGVA